MYRKILKEGNGDRKHFRCIYNIDNNFEVLRSEIALDKVDLVCEETVKVKPTRNNSGFITYPNTIYVDVIWLDKCSYLITQ